MWHPKTWDDVEAALGVLIEGPTLDFKDGAALANSREVAKDVAAMAILGGVLAYGIEDKDEVADTAPGVKLAGQLNRVQQIVDNGIAPRLGVDVAAIENPNTPGSGVLVVSVPASPAAPHLTYDRFPARSGTTTRYLSEPEIEDLYRRRASITESQGQPPPILAAFRGVPWLSEAELDMTGVGLMQTVIGPVHDRHAVDYRLQGRLGDAVQSASATIARLLAPGWQPHMLSGLLPWRPLEAVGWVAGRSELPGRDFARSAPTYGGTFLYSSGFSFHTTFPLEYYNKLYTYERAWAAGLTAMLAIAGSFYEGDPGASLLRADLSLTGLDGGTPGPGRSFASPLKVPPYRERRVLQTLEIVADPIGAARELLDRFLASILPDGPDVFAEVTVPSK